MVRETILGPGRRSRRRRPVLVSSVSRLSSRHRRVKRKVHSHRCEKPWLGRRPAAVGGRERVREELFADTSWPTHRAGNSGDRRLR